jgi:hypothetical protein
MEIGNLRIAVCLHGQLRTGVRAYPNIKRFIGNLWNQCDFFIHTWDHDEYRNLMQFHDTVKRKIRETSEIELSTYESLYSPKKFEIENQEHYTSRIRKQFGPTGNLVSMYHSFFESNEYKKEYERLHRFKYDIVIRIRPDIIYPVDRSLEIDISEFLKYVENTGNKNVIFSCRLDDFYHISFSDVSDLSAQFYKSEYMFFGNKDIWPLDQFRKHISSKEISFERFNDWRSTPLRVEAIEFDPIIEYHQCCLLNAQLYDRVRFLPESIWLYYVNKNSLDWVEDMYSVFDRILGTDISEYINQHMEQKRHTTSNI